MGTLSRTMSFLNSKTAHLLMILIIISVGPITCINLFIQSERFTEALSHGAVRSMEFQVSLLVSVIITIPMIIEMFFDSFSLLWAKEFEIHSWLIRIFLVFSQVGPNLILLTAEYPNERSATVYLCAITFINCATRASICMLLAQDPHNIGIGPASVFAAFLYVIGNVSTLFSSTAGSPSALSLVFITAAYFTFFYIYITMGANLLSSGRKWDSNHVSDTVHFAALLLVSAGSFACDHHYTNTTASLNITLQTYLNSLFLLIIMALSSQIAKMNLRTLGIKMQEKEAFVRYISHEIRTPLNTVFLGMSFIKSELINIAPLVSEYVDPIIETVNEVNNCCEVALSIVNDMLTFDRLKEGMMSLELKETEIEWYIKDTVKLFDIQARAKKISIGVMIDDAEGGWINSNVLRVDQHKMSQVIRNLVSNAIKFTPENGIIKVNMSLVRLLVDENQSKSPTAANKQRAHPSTLKPSALERTKSVQILTTKDPEILTRTLKSSSVYLDYLRIEVTDSGVGISEENQKILFGQYVQFNAGKLQQGNGSGLGLYISKGITDLHGGWIGAHSDGEETGTTFILELPLFQRSVSPFLSQHSITESGRIRPTIRVQARKESYSMASVRVHPKGSGLNSVISLADLVSLDRKIRCRNGSADYFQGSEPHDSNAVSVRTDFFGGENSDEERLGDGNMFPPSKTAFSSRSNSLARANLLGIFDHGTFRIGCDGSGTGANAVSDLEAGHSSRAGSVSGTGSVPGSGRKQSGPYTKPRAKIPISLTPQISLRILVVDDSQPTRKMMTMILCRKGYYVKCAEDGLDCLRIIDKLASEGAGVDGKELFDAIILDDSMPVMTGRETARRLRDRGYKGFICGVTGHTTVEDIQAFEENGANAVLPKPLDMYLFERKFAVFMRSEKSVSASTLTVRDFS